MRCDHKVPRVSQKVKNLNLNLVNLPLWAVESPHTCMFGLHLRRHSGMRICHFKLSQKENITVRVKVIQPLC